MFKPFRCPILYDDGHPALVEMMHFGIPVYAFDCVLNRYTTEERAQYLGNAEAITRLIAEGMSQQDRTANGSAMREIARRRYTWGNISGHYISVLQSEAKNGI
jgi:glycosyltransferase involved in cell wall biosynthesis